MMMAPLLLHSLAGDLSNLQEYLPKNKANFKLLVEIYLCMCWFFKNAVSNLDYTAPNDRTTNE
jgi:hypothetical protein